MRFILIAILCAGCGHMLRLEAGPTLVEGDGVGGTVQVLAGLPIIAGGGIFDALVIGGYATSLGVDHVSGGLVFGCDVGIVPGGPDQPRSTKQREGVGGSLRFLPRIGTDGLEFGGGLGVRVGKGRPTGDRGSIDFGGGGGKGGGGSITWSSWAYQSVGLAIDVHRRGQFDEPGVWRGDALIQWEWLTLTD